jgi:hypothetical protein
MREEKKSCRIVGEVMQRITTSAGLSLARLAFEDGLVDRRVTHCGDGNDMKHGHESQEGAGEPTRL